VSAMSWRVEVDGKKCLGSGMCIGSAPGRFVADDGGTRPVSEVVDPDDAVLESAYGCPADAITVWDSQGRRLYPDAEE
jgi:ferredoxin